MQGAGHVGNALYISHAFQRYAVLVPVVDGLPGDVEESTSIRFVQAQNSSAPREVMQPTTGINLCKDIWQAGAFQVSGFLPDDRSFHPSSLT